MERVGPTAPMLRTETHIRRDGSSTTTKSELVDHGTGHLVLKKQRNRKGCVAKDKTEEKQTEVLISFLLPGALQVDDVHRRRNYSANSWSDASISSSK